MKRKKFSAGPLKRFAIILAVLSGLAVLLFFVPWALNAPDTVTNAAGILVLFTACYAGVCTVVNKL